jgi:hypothetical protein
MRCLVGFVLFLLALGTLRLVGCGSEAGQGNCGDQGQGGGSAWIYPGLYRAAWDDDLATYQACVYVNEDCTELKASTECNIGEDSSQAHFLEVGWTDGRTETDDACAAAVGVTTDLVTRIPIHARISPPGASFSFGTEFSDTEGADWLISGYWDYDTLFLAAKRTTGDVVCRSHADYPSDSSCRFAGGSERTLCLEN